MKQSSLPPAILAICVCALAWILPDAIAYHDQASSDYRTPWYSTSWLEQPYTNLRLLAQPASEYKTRNAIGTEQWLVRDVKVGSKTFWTILQRKPI